MKKIIIISGPTASGKTNASIQLALYIKNNFQKKIAIVNFDSLLFYKEISIGSAKPTAEEKKDIEHHLIDIASINSPLNAADFILLAQKKIEELFSQNKIVILVGGSGFYLRSLLKGMYEAPSIDPEILAKSEQIYQEKGIEYFINFLKINDPESLTNLHQNDHYRLRRAVLYFESTGQKISDQKKFYDDQLPYDFHENVYNWKILHFYLEVPKPFHQKIIEDRTKKMFHDGLVAEIETLRSNGFSLQEKPLASIGYKEAIDLLNGLYGSQEECIERIIISTRQLAKSQRTFFKKMVPKITINPLNELDKIFLYCSDWVDDKLDQ
jgi:tRNA dimethylallyltransferase